MKQLSENFMRRQIPNRTQHFVNVQQIVRRNISVQLLGGELMINVGDTVTMTGEAVLVFKGEIEL